MEQELRKTAINRYLQGETPKSIYSDLGRSKNWFFKWLKRYKSGDPNWYKDQSKAPISRPTALNEIEKQRIISVRQRLESQKFAQTGVSAIKWELSKSGHGFPSDRTINRVLKREGLIKKNFIRPQGR
jgi:putative transposase